MITLAQATNPDNTEFWHLRLTNSDGSPLRVRRNGKTQTWKTRPGEWKMPAKHGLSTHIYIISDARIANSKTYLANEWSIPALWAAERELWRDAT